MNKLVGRITHCAIAVTLLVIQVTLVQANAASVKYAASVDNYVVDLFPQSCYFSGRFTEQKQLIGLSDPLLSQGQIMFACDRGLTWYTQAPITEALIYSLGHQHFFYSQERQSIKPLTGRLHNNMGKLLVSIMGADTGYIDQYFKLIDEPRKDKIYRFVPKKKAMKKFIGELRLQKISINNDVTIVVEFDQPDVGSTQLTMAKVQYRESLSMVDCLMVLNNQKICQQFSMLNTLIEAEPYADAPSQ
ncbi:MAG: hypothetical protein ACI9NY_000178 [Kiritimatiellia bacterium]|jgi:hypothetical protein